MLHLVGHCDKTPEAALDMRVAEAKFLGQFGWDAAFRNPCGEEAAHPEVPRKLPDGATTP
jgi:hypothetical protein